jgi:hypothetical protein
MLTALFSFLAIRHDKSGFLDTIRLADAPFFFTSRGDRVRHFEALTRARAYHHLDTFVSPHNPRHTNTRVPLPSPESDPRPCNARVDWSKFHSIPKVELPKDYVQEEADSEALCTSHIYYFYALLELVVESCMDCGIGRLLQLILSEPPRERLEIILACHAGLFTESICRCNACR